VILKTELYKKFKSLESYDKYSEEYELFSFNFHKFSTEKYLVVNDTGEFIFLEYKQLKKLISKSLNYFSNDKKLFDELLNKQFIYLKKNKFAIEQKAIKYRTKKQFLYSGPVLHIFVVTIRCQHKCHYCQVTPQGIRSKEHDMTYDILKKSVDMMMQSPSDYLTVEFQGGETLLAFDTVKEIVNYTNELNEEKNKDITFVLATSLVDITVEQLNFIKENNIHLSTSLDGPEDLHNMNRPIKSQNTYLKFKEGFQKSNDFLGQSPSPLLTVSRNSLNRIEDIVQEYLEFNCNSLSLRSLSPYGFAVKTMAKIGYSVEDFIEFFINSLEYIIKLNLNGIYFREDYTSLLLKRILTPYSTGYVDLQSPSGAGVNALVYYYNGEVYPADEARMLAEMGDKSFLLGNVMDDNYNDIYNNKKLEVLVNDSCAESLNGCNDCTYLQYCGCDPLFNYVTQKDHYGHRPTSDFCTRQKAIFKYLFSYIESEDSKVNDIFWSWINNAPELNTAINTKESCDNATT